MHLLVIPERHIETFRDIGEFSADEAKRMLDFVAETAKTAGLDEYRLMVFAARAPGRRSSTCTGTSSAGRSGGCRHDA